MALYPLRRARFFGGFTPVILTLAGLVWATLLGSVALAFAGSSDEPEPTFVLVDIRPGLCPNHLRIESPLTIPIAITGRLDFEIEQIDPGSIRLSREGFAEKLEPAAWAYADVGTPTVGGLCACHKLQGDGIDDLEFQFSIKEVVTTFDLEGSPGETIELTLTGNLTTGEEIEGTDCAQVISGLWNDEALGDEIFILASPAGGATPGQFKFAYQTMVSDRVTFAIHDVRGRVVAVLNNMDMAPGIYTATWDGVDRDKYEAPAGIYFARVSNSLASDIKKVTIP